MRIAMNARLTRVGKTLAGARRAFAIALALLPIAAATIADAASPAPTKSGATTATPAGTTQAWIVADPAAGPIQYSPSGVPVAAPRGGSAGAVASKSPQAWVATDPGHASRVQFPPSGNPSITPANGAAGASATPAARDFAAADPGRMGKVQVTAGVPSVPADPKRAATAQAATTARWISTQSDRASAVQLNSAGTPVVPASKSSPVASPAAAAAAQQWIKANPAAGNVQFPASGAPTVTATQAPAPAARTLTSTQALTIDNRIVALPPTGSRPGGAITNGSASPPAVTFGNVPINTTVTQNVTITVDFGYQVLVASGSGINAPFSFAFDTCSSFTGPGICNVKESFTPTSLAASNGTTNVFECPIAGGSCIAIPFTVSGTGISVASAVPSTIPYGNVPINTTVLQGVTISVDTGYQVLIASGSGINAPFSFAFDTCSSFTGPGTCNVNESFHPTALATSNGTTNVFECPVAGGSCLPIPYTESGTGISVASAVPSTIPYGNVPINTTVLQGVTISVDTGYQVLLASGSGINAPFSFAFDTCNSFTGPGTCNVNESFHPTALATSNGTTNVFECPVAGGSCLPIPYTESGTGVSVASAVPSAIPFGNVPINTTVVQGVTITVDTGYSVDLASGSGINAPFSFAFDTCSSFPGPGTCNVNESFHPTSLATSNGTTNVFECPIAGGLCIPIPYTESGTGISVAVANPPGIDFGDVPINTTVLQHTTLTVDTGYSVQLASGSGINPPFIFGFGNCGSFPGPGTCIVDQSFHPTSLTTSNGVTNVFECPIAGGSCIPIPYNVMGNGIAPTPVFQGAVSRRTHAASGTFDLALSSVPTNPTTEPRVGPAQTIVFTFDKPISGATASISEGTATTGALTFSGNDVVVPLTGVSDKQYVTVSLTNVASADGGAGGSGAVRLGFLAGDVNGSRIVAVTDLVVVNAQLGKPLTASNFRADVNASGIITVLDKVVVNNALGHFLPAP